MQLLLVALDPDRLEAAVRALRGSGDTIERSSPCVGSAGVRDDHALVLTDSEEIWAALRRDVATAADRVVCIPAAVGAELARELLALACKNRSLASSLEALQARQDLVLETAHEGVWIVDEYCSTTFVNGRMAAMLGYSREELLGAWMFDVIATEGDELVPAHGDDRVGGCGEQHEFRFRRKDGTHVWALLSTSPIRAANGEYRGALAMITDVTERKAAEGALRRNEESLSLTLESIGEGVITVAVDGSVVRMNAMAERMTGWATGDAQGRPVDHVVHLFHDPACTTPAARSTGGDEAAANGPRRSLWLRSAKGGVLVVADATSPMVDARGQLCGSVVVLRDLSADQRASEAEARLSLAERMAAIGTMVAGVSHEINNPLAYVLGNVEYVQSELSAAAARVPASSSSVEVDRQVFIEWLDALDQARCGAARVGAVVRDLKTFAREPRQDDRPADPRAVTASTLLLARNEIRHSARIVERLQDVPFVALSESRLGQVLLNVLVNAAQAVAAATSANKLVEVATYTSADGFAVVDVRDTGDGIPKEHLSRIFDPFFTTKPVGVGTGLGLSICHGIVSSAGGSIEVESEIGRGTLIRLRLPPVERARSLPPPPLTPPLARRARILVIDDEPGVLAWARRVLRRECDVVTTSSGTEAVRRIAEGERFDVILCDLMMPDMSGMDVHAALAEVAPSQRSRMVFVSGGAFTAGARDFIESVPNTRLEKPFTAEALRGLVAGGLRV